jgi:hypothetical protein
MKFPPKAPSPTLLRILLHSGFWTKCGAPHFVHLLLKPQSAARFNDRDDGDHPSNAFQATRAASLS